VRGAPLAPVVQARRERNDTVGGIWTDLETLTPGVAVEAGRKVLKRLFISAGYAYASYAPRGQIPEPAARGTAYKTLIAPEIEATPAITQAVSLSLRWQVRDGTALWATARSESLAPTTPGLMRPTSFRPDGSRTASFVAFGVALTAPDAER
jgi:hypothetical protein